MIKNGITLVFFVGILALFAIPASAAGLIPVCGEGGCTLCDIWPLANNIINLLLFGLAIPLLTVVLIWGGVMWTTAGASPGNIEQGKKIMTSGIVGILIAFSAWLIVDTIIKSLASGGNVIGAWQEFPSPDACKNPELAKEKFDFQSAIPAGMAPAKNWVLYGCNVSGCLDPNKLSDFTRYNIQYSSEAECKSKGPELHGGPETFTDFLGAERTNWKCVYEPSKVANPEASPEGTLSDESARKTLLNAGIAVVSTGNCSDKTKSDCTSLDGIRPEVIAEVLTLKNQCPSCTIAVSGGTETGHSTKGTYNHGNGYKIDIQTKFADTNNFIQTSPLFIPTVPRDNSDGHGGPQFLRQNRQNISYVQESNPSHWDITVQP